MKTKNFQFIFWNKWRGFSLKKQADKNSSWKYIYDWFLNLGFFEIRKWHKLTDKEKRTLNKYR